MISQSEYNDWFKLMLKKHLRPPYQLSKETYEDNTYYVAEIVNPYDKENHISISSYGRELTLSFWQHHEHHDSFEDDNHEEEFKDLCEYIEDIIKDKVLFSVSYKNGKISSVMAAYKKEDFLDPDSLVEPEKSKIVVKSWSGKHDEIIE